MGNKKSDIISEELKYQLYEKSVQCPEFDVDFFNSIYKKKNKKNPMILREDFCGTGWLTCDWVKQGPYNKSIGIDLDDSPLNYGKRVHHAALSSKEQKRAQYVKKNVLKCSDYKADIVAALNFSYFIFKERKDLLKYFQAVKESMRKGGIFVLDIFGGVETQSPIVDEIKHDKFTYYWDCDSYNAITNEVLYKIHFKMKNSRTKFEDVFVYDWRMWTIPEIKDVLKDAGFKNVDVYWEGDDNEGGGDGDFYISKEEENCDSWIAYIAAH